MTQYCTRNENLALQNYDGGTSQKDGVTTHSSHENEDNPADYPEGGWRAWCVVLGAWCGMFPAFGLMNTLGVFEDWLSTHQLHDNSQAKIAWIMSIYVFFLFFGSVQAGPIFDVFGPKYVLVPGSIGMIGAIMILSVASRYYQFMLGFGVLGGISASLLVTPSMGCINHWFLKRRAFATGIGVTAGGIGGVIFPIMMKNLSKIIGFAWATRILGLISLVLCILAVLLQKTRLPPNRKGIKTIDIWALQNPSFTLTAIGMVLTDSSGAIPMVYLTSYARANGLGLALSYQLMSILNGGSIIGRLAPGYVADKFGRFNIMVVTTAISTVLTPALWLSCGQNQAAIVSYAALFGFSSGSAISLTPVCVAQISRTEDFGKRFGTTYTLVGLGVLVAIPVAGQTLNVRPTDGVGGYSGLILFCGVIQAVALVCFILARGLRTRWQVRRVF
ncbi:putative monocarboxylate permease [Aspergillus ambiguus]|uniref:MCT family MFS transporter n=1 Tax=Aspergillus ambiguus TaxID=176160 RepID=UPI003CCDEDE4